MKVMTVLGSPRKRGNTAKVLGWVEDELRAQGHELSRLNIGELEVKGCLGCGACQKTPDAPACVQEDDAVGVFERMIAANAVIYASPLYCWGFSSQIKALIDRHFCLVTGYGTPQYKSLLQGKRTALLVSCAGPIENNADLIQGVFDRLNDYALCAVVGKYVVPFCTTPDAMGAEARETASRMARDIGGA